MRPVSGRGSSGRRRTPVRTGRYNCVAQRRSGWDEPARLAGAPDSGGHGRSPVPPHCTRAVARAPSRPRWGSLGASQVGGAGWEVNRKPVQRLWREEWLRDPERRRSAAGWRVDGPEPRLQAERPNHLSLDFQFDRAAAGRGPYAAELVYTFTRESLKVLVECIGRDRERAQAAHGRRRRAARLLRQRAGAERHGSEIGAPTNGPRQR